MTIDILEEKQNNFLNWKTDFNKKEIKSVDITECQFHMHRQTGRTYLLCKHVQEDSVIIVYSRTNAEEIKNQIKQLRPEFNINSLYFVGIPSEVNTFKKLRNFLKNGMRGVAGSPIPLNYKKIYYDNVVFDLIISNEINKLYKVE